MIAPDGTFTLSNSDLFRVSRGVFGRLLLLSDIEVRMTAARRCLSPEAWLEVFRLVPLETDDPDMFAERVQAVLAYLDNPPEGAWLH